MLINDFKTALRYFRRRKSATLITVFGLALGLTCALLIGLYVRQELSFDAFHAGSDHIYRLAVRTQRPSGVRLHANTPFPVGPAFATDYPEMRQVVRIFRQTDVLIQTGERQFTEKNLIYADPDFFQLFSFPLLKGDPRDALNSPDAIVLTASTAEKLFGDEDPIGQRLRVMNERDYSVTGVMDDPPVDSHMHFTCALSFLGMDEEIAGFSLDQWGAFSDCWTYIRMPEMLNPEDFAIRIESFLMKHGNYSEGLERSLFLQPLRDIHLKSHLDGEFEPNNHTSTLMILSIIALFILAVAGINHINLATAQSARRAREVGMRKVLGARKHHLLRQFLWESLILAFCALALSLSAFYLLLPVFSSLVGTQVTVPRGDLGGLLGGALGLSLILGFVSGIYPALILAGFQPVRVLKGAADTGRTAPGRLLFRRILVVFQFAVSILLIIGTLVVNSQLHFLRSARLGFDKEQMVMVPFYQEQDFFDESINRDYESVKSEILSNTDVISCSACMRAPISTNNVGVSVYPEGPEGESRFVFQLNFVDYGFLGNFSLPLIAGRNFSPEFTRDRFHAFILNRTAVKTLGYASPEDAIGKKFTIGINKMEGSVIGVTDDYHIDSLREEIEPVALLYWPSLFYQAAVKVRPGGISGALGHLEKVWKTFHPQLPFEYAFLDENIGRLYRREERTAAVVRTFSLIAILIACLGLFSLAAHTAQRRTKEIGVRKVLGASSPRLALMLSSEFTRWVLVANLLAWPVAWWAMRSWLQGFAFRAKLGPLPFLTAAALAFGIALLTVSFQAIRAARADPIKSLRYE